MRDHREPAQPEQIRAAVRVGIEALPEPAGGRPDEEAADPAAAARGDLLAQGVEDGRDRSLRQLESDVAGEAVADDDVCGAAEEVAALRVAAEVEPVRVGE